MSEPKGGSTEPPEPPLDPPQTPIFGLQFSNYIGHVPSCDGVHLFGWLRKFMGIVYTQHFCACNACHFHRTWAVSVQHSIANILSLCLRHVNIHFLHILVCRNAFLRQHICSHVFHVNQSLMSIISCECSLSEVGDLCFRFNLFVRPLRIFRQNWKLEFEKMALWTVAFNCFGGGEIFPTITHARSCDVYVGPNCQTKV